MRFLMVVAAGVLMAACGTTPTDSAACQTIAVQVAQLISTSKRCAVDTDCTCYLQTACGLYGECGVSVNVLARPQLDALITEWAVDCPTEATSCTNCGAQPGTAICRAHVCACQ